MFMYDCDVNTRAPCVCVCECVCLTHVRVQRTPYSLETESVTELGAGRQEAQQSLCLCRDSTVLRSQVYTQPSLAFHRVLAS